MKLSYRQWILICVTLWVGAWLRLHHLADIPTGIHFDEAANGLLSADIGLNRYRPVFIESYTGKEVLFFYITGGLMRLLGMNVWVLRLSAMLIGWVTIAVTIRLGRELFPRNRWAGIGTGILLATNFSQILFSRLGFRAITQPLLQALTILFLLYAIRKKSWKYTIVAGLFLGLSGYTYLAVRLFPVVLAILIVYLLIQNWRDLSRIGLFLLVGCLTVSPLLRYFYQNPDTLDRTNNILCWQNNTGIIRCQ